MNDTLAQIKGITKPVLAGLQKLGISTVQGLLLHLPLRYVDETRITPIRELRGGDQAQVEGEIIHAEVQYKPRKTLVCRLQDANGQQLTLRFLHFYPSQVAALLSGAGLDLVGDADIESWDRLEAEDPFHFAGMYQFYCRTPAQVSSLVR